MQDKKKNKDSKRHKTRQAIGKIGNKSRLNVLVMRGISKTWRFTISSRVLFFALLFLVFFILFSLFIINDYFEGRHVNRRLSRQLEVAGTEIQRIKKALYRTEQQLTIFKEHINDKEAKAKTSNEEARSDSIEKENLEVADKSQAPPEDESTPRKPQALVEDLKTTKEGAKLAVSFRLENKLDTGGALKGYIHMIAVGRDSDGHQLWTYPKVALKDGLPINYKRGWHFVIRRFKVIQGEFFFDSESISPSFIKVIVYDNDGELICEKIFET